jgi:hypothetical protein
LKKPPQPQPLISLCTSLWPLSSNSCAVFDASTTIYTTHALAATPAPDLDQILALGTFLLGENFHCLLKTNNPSSKLSPASALALKSKPKNKK